MIGLAALRRWNAKTIESTMAYAFRLALRQSQHTLYTRKPIRHGYNYEMRLGICCALSSELKTLTVRKIQPGEIVSMDRDTLIALSGMGPGRAHITAMRLIEEGATSLLSWGSAAALDECLSPGTLIVPKKVITQDGKIIPVSQDWHQRLLNQLGKKFEIRTGSLAETAAVLTGISQKRSLAIRRKAIAADMETAAIAKASSKHNIPWLAVRAISDTAMMRVPEGLTHAVDLAGRLPLNHVLTDVILRPKDWAAIIRLALGMHSALASLKGIRSVTGSRDLR
jgi:adenosylhomocysteine nucleosidase